MRYPQRNAPAAPKVAVPVKIISYNELGTDGALRGFVTLAIGKPGNELTVYDARFIRQPGQKGFVSPPQRTSTDPATGQKKYHPILTWPRSWGDSIMEALERYLADQPAAGRLFGGERAN